MFFDFDAYKLSEVITTVHSSSQIWPKLMREELVRFFKIVAVCALVVNFSEIGIFPFCVACNTSPSGRITWDPVYFCTSERMLLSHSRQ